MVNKGDIHCVSKNASTSTSVAPILIIFGQHEHTFKNEMLI